MNGVSSPDRFESPKALLSWAYEDIQRFKELEGLFFDNEPYERIVEFDEEMGRDAHRIRFVKAVPDEMRKLASHIINDLRHSLDQAFVIAARHFGWEPSKKQTFIYFPWATCRSDLEGRLRLIPKEIHGILFEAQPYPAQGDSTGGNDAIRQLGTIAGPNKHEAVLTSHASAMLAEMKINWNADWRVPFVEKMWDGAKDQLTYGYFPVGTQGDYNVELAFQVSFREMPGFEQHPASHLFDYWGSYANHFVERFERRVVDSLS